MIIIIVLLRWKALKAKRLFRFYWIWKGFEYPSLHILIQRRLWRYVWQGNVTRGKTFFHYRKLKSFVSTHACIHVDLICTSALPTSIIWKCVAYTRFFNLGEWMFFFLKLISDFRNEWNYMKAPTCFYTSEKYYVHDHEISFYALYSWMRVVISKGISLPARIHPGVNWW